MPDESEQQRKEYSRLSRLLLNPGNVYLSRSDEGAWLTDKFVVINVAGFPVTEGIEPGWYRIVQTGAKAGFRPPTKDDAAENAKAVWHLNIPKLLKEFRSRDYCAVIPTEIGFRFREDEAESEAKAFLLIVDTAPAARYAAHRLIPAALNEEVWARFRLAWPEATLSHPGYTGPFRISVPGNEELAYIEPIQIPERLHKVVIAVMEAYEI